MSVRNGTATLSVVAPVAAVVPIEQLEQEPARQRNRRRAYTPEECIQLAHIWAEAMGAAPAHRDWNPALRRKSIRNLLTRIRENRDGIARFEEGGYPSDATVRKLFGSWNAFLHAAGWEPRGVGRPESAAAIEPPATPTREQVRREVGQRAERASFGRQALASVVRSVIQAESAGDDEALHDVLLDGAAQMLAWADYIERKQAASREGP